MIIRCCHRIPSPEAVGFLTVEGLREAAANIRTCGPARSMAGTGCIGRPARSVETKLKCRLKVRHANTKKARCGATGQKGKR